LIDRCVSTGISTISMTTIVHAVKGGLLSYYDKVYSRGNINQKHCIGGVKVSVLASSAVDRGRNVTPFGHIILIPSQPIFALSP
jgi:hypothetical protein